jgi:hypothetical protein
MYIRVKGNCSQIGRHEEAMTPEDLHVFFWQALCTRSGKSLICHRMGPWPGCHQKKPDQSNFLPIVI